MIECEYFKKKKNATLMISYLQFQYQWFCIGKIWFKFKSYSKTIYYTGEIYKNNSNKKKNFNIKLLRIIYTLHTL